ncbi:MAG: hypothetical protein Q8N57_01245 [bacterium]|nr:hypothetical protein [bacterium]
MTKIATNYASQRTVSGLTRFNLKYFNVCLFAGLAVLGVMYLINISDLTVQGFSLRDLKSRVSDLASEKMANEEAVNAAQSYYSLNARAQGLDMVAIDDVEYLPASSLTVARK